MSAPRFTVEDFTMPIHEFARPRGRIVTIQIESEALKGNLLGDPSSRAVGVYLPPEYDSSSDHLPVFVDIVGFTGSGFAHLNWKAFNQSVPQRLDRLVDEGKMGPVVAVFPDCFTSLGGNQYINSLAMGNWEDFLIEEMMPQIEKEFRVRPGGANRAIFGKSSGGYGALIHGMRHPDAWAAIACHSGDMDFDLVYRPDFPKVLQTLAKYEGSVEAFMKHLREGRKISGGEFHVLMSLAMAATYDPDPDAPYGVRLPVDPHTCALDEEAWARWLAHDPVHLIEQPGIVENLRSLKGIYVDVGDEDQYDIQFGTRRLVQSLERYGVAHKYEEFHDNHSGVDYRMDVSLPFLYEAIAS
jgi:enterochelin esterase-like enzyme